MVFLTGGSGFIGSHTLNYLIAKKIKTRCLIRQKNINFFSTPILDELHLDISSATHKHFNGIDTLIHLAWGNLSNYEDPLHLEHNLMESYFFIKKAIESGVKTICIAGTCFEYGVQNGCLAEDMQTKPCTSYALAKDTLRKMLTELQKQINFRFIWLRLWYVYGKGQATHTILAQLQNAINQKKKVFNMSDGEQLRDYLSVEEMAQRIVNIALHPSSNGIYNVCSGFPISIRKFVENYLQKTNQDIALNFGHYPYPQYEPMAFWGDTQKQSSILAKMGREGGGGGII